MDNIACTSHRRLIEIDITRAIAIVLVVIGHWGVTYSFDWWESIVKWIYTFHMPLFIAMAGYLFMHTSWPNKIEGYIRMLRKKFMRIMVPYIIVSIIIITIKLLFQRDDIYIQHPITLYSYLEILWFPSAGYFLWFCWAIMWMFILTPIFKSHNARLILFLLALGLNLCPWVATEMFCLKQTQQMLVYFVFGQVLYDIRGTRILISNIYLVIGWIILICAWIAMFMNVPYITEFIPYITIIIIPCTFSSVKATVSYWILSLSSASFLIYLLHTTFEGFAKAATRFLWSTGNTIDFILAATISISAGILIPWLLHRWIKI